MAASDLVGGSTVETLKIVVWSPNRIPWAPAGSPQGPRMPFTGRYKLAQAPQA